MKDKNYTIKTMDRAEVDIAIEWAAKEGWNPGIHDADCYFAADSSGFLIGMLGDEPIATISVMKYDESFGFLGFYIVKPEYRGKGYGIQIWNAGLKYLEGRNIGLDGVLVQQDQPLARAIYRRCKVGQFIPSALYEAVAVVIATAYRRRIRGIA